MSREIKAIYFFSHLFEIIITSCGIIYVVFTFYIFLSLIGTLKLVIKVPSNINIFHVFYSSKKQKYSDITRTIR
jgi:hypothetical protein